MILCTIYTKDSCPWCVKAKDMLTGLGIEYEELHLNQEYTREELMELVGPDEALTVPQIIMNGKRIGGFEALLEYVESHGIMGLQN